MDWFRKLSPRAKRIAIIAGATALGVGLVMLSRRGGGASSASTETLDAAGVPMAAGVLPGAYLPNADYSSSTSTDLADIRDGIAEVGRRIDDVGALIPSPTAASDVAQAVGEVLRPIVDSALAATVTTAPPVTASPAPAAPAAPQPAPRAVATGPVGGRRVGPWATAAQRDNAVKGVPAGKVRKYREGGKFWAEIFD